MSAHIIGRPGDDLLEILLGDGAGDGADPERAFIGGREQGREQRDGSEEGLRGEEPAMPEQ